MSAQPADPRRPPEPGHPPPVPPAGSSGQPAAPPIGSAAGSPPEPPAGAGALRWVARPPAPVRPYRRFRPRTRYAGPPSYPAPPRWGFPSLVWRWPTALAGLGPQTTPVEQTVRLARDLGIVLPVLAGASGLAAVGELWRYILLWQSLSGALNAHVVLASDLLVTISGVLALLGSVLAGGLGLLWLIRARQAATAATGVEPARPGWQVVLGTVLPGANLAIPGSALAELEHVVLRRPTTRRPRPTRLLRTWWAAWGVGAILLVITTLWYLGGSPQAQVDGVLWHALADAVAAVICVLSLRVVHYLTALLAPVDLTAARWMRVVRVAGAPAPPLRAGRPAGARR